MPPENLTEKGCFGAPDWIIEVVSPGSRRMDYYIKLFKYRTAGVAGILDRRSGKGPDHGILL